MMRIGLQGVLTFGKYKGVPVARVVDIDPEYILWAHSNVEWLKFDDDVFYAALDSRAGIDPMED